MKTDTHKYRQMKNRIKELLSNRKNGILSMYYTAGFPTLTATGSIAESLAAAGADIIEIGIPYSDPVADGPTIQASNVVALKNGMRLSTLIEQVRVIRTKVDVPIILMGYINPVLQYGIENLSAMPPVRVLMALSCQTSQWMNILNTTKNFSTQRTLTTLSHFSDNLRGTHPQN